MKRILSIILATLLLTGVGAFALADGSDGSGSEPLVQDSTSINVGGTYRTLEAGEQIYVDISWEGMSFTYTPAHKGGWNPDDHNYGTNEAAKWESSNGSGCGKITATNRSDPAVADNIHVNFVFNPNTAINGLYMKFAGSEANVKSSSASDYQRRSYDMYLDSNTGSTDHHDDVYVLPAVPPTTTSFPGNNLGSITVTISRANYAPGIPGGPEIFD